MGFWCNGRPLHIKANNLCNGRPLHPKYYPPGVGQSTETFNGESVDVFDLCFTLTTQKRLHCYPKALERAQGNVYSQIDHSVQHKGEQNTPTNTTKRDSVLGVIWSFDHLLGILSRFTDGGESVVFLNTKK